MFQLGDLENQLIIYKIVNDGSALLKLNDTFDIEIAILGNEFKSTSSHEDNFNATPLTTGVYLYKIQSGNFVKTKKMIILK